jgi:hypothetical protein
MNFIPAPSFTKAIAASGKANSAVTCSIVIVCFHSLDELRPCLSLLSAGPSAAEVEIIVVNNSQTVQCAISSWIQRR